jgi:hypothetical protein
MPKAVVLVFTECTDPAREEEFNEWYDNTHVPDVLETSGFVSGIRYELVGNPGPGQGKYLAIYDVESDDLPSAMAALQQRVVELAARKRLIDCIRLVSVTACRARGRP